jgi:hypothetical protein
VVTPGELLTAALRYAELGYRVFPCWPGSKKPVTEHGFHDASTDAAQIEKWWSRHPTANIGIAAEGMLVVDIDGADNPWPGDPERAADLAGAGAVAQTPRGGRHYLFRRLADKNWKCSTGQLACGVDVRTDGGYIVAPPSEIKEGPYRWADTLELDDRLEQLPEPPPWLVAQLDRLATGTPPLAPRSPTAGQGVPDANPIPSGQRNATLAKLAGTMRRVGMGRVEIAAALHQTNRVRCVPPLAEREVDRIAESVARYRPDEVSVALVENHYDQTFQCPTAAAGPPDPGPFPGALLAVPGFVGEVTDYTLATAFRRQPVLALAGALALLGTLTGRKVRDEVDTRTNVYCLGVCPTGGGKERARLVNKEILFLAGAEKLAGPEGLASHAGLITAVEQQPAILFQLDEVGRLLRTLADPGRSPHLYHIATNLMKLFTSSASVYLGDAYADAKRNKVIHQPHACLWGTTVPQSLYEGFTAENVTDGFLSRVMIFECAQELPPKRKPARLPIPQGVIGAAKYWAEFNPSGNLNQEHPEPVVIAATTAAEGIFDALDAEADAAQRDLGEPLGSLWTRATEKARKLALLYACSRDARNPAIDEPAATWACDLSRYLTRRLVFLAGRWVAENPFDARRKRVLRLVADAGEHGITRSDLYGKTRAFTNRERAEILEALVACGDIREVTQPSGRQGGAPGVRYVATAVAGGSS